MNFLSLGLITWFSIYFAGIFNTLSQGKIPLEDAIPIAIAFGFIVWSKVDSEAAPYVFVRKAKYRFQAIASIIASAVNLALAYY